MNNGLGVIASPRRSKEAARRFQNLLGGGPSETRQVGRDHSRLRRTPGMQRLRHGAEVLAQARGFAGRYSQGQVERVDVGTNRNVPNALIHHHPKTGLEAKFSMEFCMAALLLYGKAGLSEFTDEVVNRSAVQNMIGRIRFGVNPVAEAAGYNKMTTILEIRLQDGRTISGRADFAKGSPAIPMSYEETAEKFLDCAAFAQWPRDKAKSAIELVRKLETVSDVRSLTALLAG